MNFWKYFRTFTLKYDSTKHDVFLKTYGPVTRGQSTSTYDDVELVS